VKRVAFLGRGGHTLPTYRALLNEISTRYELTVYSEVPVEKQWLDLQHNYVLRAPLSNRRVGRRLREILLLLTLFKDHLKKPFDLVHAHSTYPTGFVAVLFQVLLGVPAIVSLHAAEASAFPDIPFGDLLYRKRTIMNRWVLNRARVVTTLTNFQRKEVEKNLKIRRPMNVIYRGVDQNRFYDHESDRRQRPVVFLAVGYINNIKDPETLLRTFELIQREIDSVLVLVGRDYTNGQVRSLAQKLGISSKVKFEGWVDHDMIANYYQAADLLLHTSRYESQGMVVAEAFASGLVVAGTDVGLMSDLSGTCCVTAPTRDPEALAKAILDLLREPLRMEQMRVNALEWSKRHSLENSAAELQNLYESVIKQ
jgi:glycosyltransferase involved in cell wall biosynthesis